MRVRHEIMPKEWKLRRQDNKFGNELFTESNNNARAGIYSDPENTENQQDEVNEFLESEFEKMLERRR